MKKLISFIALLDCISINAVERSFEMDFVQTVDGYGYREWEGRGVAFFVDEHNGIFGYTQDGDFEIELYKGAIETASYKNGLGGVKMPVNIYSMEKQLVLYNISDEPIDDECPPGFSRESMQGLPIGTYYVVGSFGSEKPKQEITETRMSMAMVDKAKNVQKINVSSDATHYTGIIKIDGFILKKEIAEARGLHMNKDRGRMHKRNVTSSTTRRTDGGGCSDICFGKFSYNEQSNKETKKSKKPSNPFAD